ncbi:hypothetical protein GCM10010251_86960 [Streptomyces aurantiogriseus]|uniref:Uncharacterized protein n=1 Tax=Streptomyces aurantiogriseus TaxID=66870 RepID=A0A918KZP0_9ACTN|nr:hypothetical protein GCM10010251_86960 [Streptomyces aurantiogriseus]
MLSAQVASPPVRCLSTAVRQGTYAVVAGWHDHVVGLIDTLSAGRRHLTDPLRLQEQLLLAAEDGPQPFGTLVGRCSLEAVARAHAIHLLWHANWACRFLAL